MNVRSGHAAIDAGVVEIPQRSVLVAEIVRLEQGPHNVIGLRILHQTAFPVGLEHGRNVVSVGQLENLQSAHIREQFQHRHAQQGVEFEQGYPRQWFYQNSVRTEGCRSGRIQCQRLGGRRKNQETASQQGNSGQQGLERSVAPRATGARHGAFGGKKGRECFHGEGRLG